MICPRCQQQAEELTDEGRCPYCRYPVADYHRQITMVQIVLGAIFGSTLIYGVVVAVLELAVGYRPTGAGEPSNIFVGGLLVALLGVVVFFRRAEARALSASEPPAMRSALVVAAALAEAPAIYGLLMYLLFGSIMWFAIFVGASWLLFLRLGMSLPQYLNTLRDALGRE